MADEKDAPFPGAPSLSPGDEHRRPAGISLLGIKNFMARLGAFSWQETSNKAGVVVVAGAGGISAGTEERKVPGEVESSGVTGAHQQAARAHPQWETREARVQRGASLPLLEPDHIRGHGRAPCWPFSTCP